MINNDIQTKDIAKQIKKDLKEWFTKNFKFSVTVVKGSIDKIEVSITQWTIDFYTNEYLEADKNDDYNKTSELREANKMYTVEWEAVLQRVKKMVDLYNYNHSDYQSDHFDVNYNSKVECDYNYKKVVA